MNDPVLSGCTAPPFQPRPETAVRAMRLPLALAHLTGQITEKQVLVFAKFFHTKNNLFSVFRSSIKTGFGLNLARDTGNDVCNSVPDCARACLPGHPQFLCIAHLPGGSAKPTTMRDGRRGRMH
jgi:hypothetical protein